MATVETPVGDKEILGYMLIGLNLAYEPLVASITVHNDTVSFNNFYAYFLNTELRL